MGCAASSTVDADAHGRKECYSTKVFDQPVEPPPSSPTAAQSRPLGSFHDEYRLIARLGQGAFASVHLAKASGGEYLAVKITDLRRRGSTGWTCSQLDTKKWECASKEKSILDKVAGLEHVVKCFGSFVEGGMSYILMEKCDMGLYQALTRRQSSLTEASVAQTFSEMLKGIAVVHGVGVVHRDVKPDNFMVSGVEGTVKLCDFGLAAIVDPSHNASAPVLKGIFGTPPYMAPEMVLGSSYGAKVDVWSLGVIVYLLFFGKFPYQPVKPTGAAMKAAIVAGVPAPTFTLDGRTSQRGSMPFSHHALWFSRLLLERAPGHRMKAKDALRHAFFDMPLSERGTASLRPMLHSAKRMGAFSPPCHDEPSSPSNMERRLAELQEQRQKPDEPPATVKAFEGRRRCRDSPSDTTSSTGVGSEGDLFGASMIT